MIERSNANVALEKLFDEVYEMIDAAKKVPFMDKIMLNEDDLVSILDDLKKAIPQEIKTANDVLEEQKNIVSNAYADADRIVQEAKVEAERLINVAKAEAEAKLQQEEVVKQAHAVAEEVKAEVAQYEEETKAAADAYSEHVRNEADAYALSVKNDCLDYSESMLAFIDKTLKSAVENIQENRDNINNAREELGRPQPPQEDIAENEIVE